MASSKDQPPSARPVSGNFSRLSSSGRQHSTSLSLSATNSSHRVNRRKSVNASASTTAQAAIAAALKEHGEANRLALSSSHRRSVGSKKSSESQSMSARPSMHSYFTGPAGAGHPHEQDAVEDNSVDEDMSTPDKNFTANRNRRASEGSQLTKGSGKKSELRCDSCGKGYKHSSCLTKHMWEHDPAWAYTSKLLISKHQQVQLLEAASVLCNMTTEPTPTPSELDASQVDPSEGSSASPGFSGSSEMQDELSSVETTPPPMSESAYPVPDTKRYSLSSAGFSRSYRSIPSSSFTESVISPGLPPQRFSGVDFRPTTSGTDDGSLAAATAGLNFGGTPKTRPSMGAAIPPVPPLPQQYQSFNSRSSGGTLTNVYDPLVMQPSGFTQQLSDERHYKEDANHRKDFLASARTHLEDEEMFKMEE